MAPFIFIVVGMMTLVFTLFPIKATVWLEERLLVTVSMFPVFLSVIFVPTETDGVGVTVGAEVIAGVGVAVGTGVAVGIGSLAIVSVLVTPQTVQVYVFMPSSAIVAGLVITPLFQVCLPEAGISVTSFFLSHRVQ